MPTKKKTPARKAAAKTKPAKSARKTSRKSAAKSAGKSARKSTAKTPVKTPRKTPPKKAQGIPDGMSAVTPHLVCAGAAEAIAFYKTAFNAVEEGRMPTPDGKIMHASIRIGGAAIMMVDEMPDWGVFSPKSLKGSPVTIHLYVADADAVVAQAVQAGAKIVMPLSDTFWGDRYGKIEDPFGHQWSIGTHLRDVPMAEMQQAMEKMCAQPAPSGGAEPTQAPAG